MKEYAAGLAICAITVGLISSLSPEENRKYVNGAGSVLFLLMLLSPLRSLNGLDVQALAKKYELSAENYISEIMVSEIRNGIINEFLTASLKDSGINCRVEAESESQNGDTVFMSVTVITDKEPSKDEYKQIIKCLTEQTGIEPDNISFITVR